MNNNILLPLSKETSFCIEVVGQIFLASSALNIIYEVSRGVRSSLRVKQTISALALGILGKDLYKVGQNLKKFYEEKKVAKNLTLGLLGNTSSQELAQAIFKDTILENLYYNLCFLITKNFTLVKIDLI